MDKARWPVWARCLNFYIAIETAMTISGCGRWGFSYRYQPGVTVVKAVFNQNRINRVPFSMPAETRCGIQIWSNLYSPTLYVINQKRLPNENLWELGSLRWITIREVSVELTRVREFSLGSLDCISPYCLSTDYKFVEICVSSPGCYVGLNLLRNSGRLN